MNLSFSVSAVQAANSRFNEAAMRVGQGPLAPDFAANVVDLKVAQREVEAAVQVVRARSENMGYLIDQLA